MHEMFAWYIDNNAYISKEFIDQLIADKEAADAQGLTIRNIILNRNPERGNPSAAITGARNAGLLGKDEEYSDALLLYKAGIYPLSMLLFEIAAKRNVAKSEPIPMKPLVCLCKIFSLMSKLEVAKSERFVTTAEVYEYISVLDDYSGITQDLVSQIISKRVYSRTDAHIPDKRVAVQSEVYLSMLFSMLCGTPLFKHGEQKTVISFEDKYVELIHYIALEGENISNAPIAQGRDNSSFYDYCMDINNGIMEIVPRVPLKDGVEIPKEYTKDVFEYLFAVDNTNFPQWNKFFSTDCKGIYRIFYPIRWIALIKVYLQNKAIGEHLLDYAMQADKYLDSWKDGRLMIELPFSSTGHTELSNLITPSADCDQQTARFLSPEWFRIEATKYATVDAETEVLYQQFQSLYAPDKLRALDDGQLLTYMFLGASEKNLCNALEFDSQYTPFGSIAGGVAYNYFLFYNKNEETWKTSFGDGGQRNVSPEEALAIGKQIRDALVCGADIIANWETLTTVNDYSALLDQLNAAIPQLMAKMWCLKYYHMLFPNIFPVFYSEAWQKHILCNLNIVPSDARFVRMGQINTFTKECGISSVVFSKIIIDNLGAPKSFYRIGTGDNGSYFDEWRKKNYVAIGWNGLGNLSEVYQEDMDAKAIITDALKSQWNYDSRLASRKYREINNFYSCAADTTYVVAMAGQKLYAIGVVAGSYFYDDDRDYAHCRPVRWLKIFESGKTLPFESEGKLTTFVELKNSENLCYLYQLLYGSEDILEITELSAPQEEPRKIRFDPGYVSSIPRNRILFGAPGTGKSFTLNGDRKELLYGDRFADEENLDLSQYGEYERVTFHPDYSYANFVGTYKPVPCIDSEGKDAITYSYVPGPFMRTYVKALKNSKTDTIKPYLLIIEEINRANVAAVFGDVFQLLDRGDDEVSEYAIQASEDIKKYLADQLGGRPDDYSEIRIPDNMFIWATMNSADQGVFPMDTAFKRRWDFTYLGIDDSEAGIAGKKVILGKGDHRKVVEWNELRKAINEELLTYKVNEDKLMGPYFISKKMLPEGDTIDPKTFTRIFKNKVIMYLFDDAAKQKRITLFGGCADKDKNQYSKICAAFDTLGVDIFCDSISSKFLDKAPEGDEE